MLKFAQNCGVLFLEGDINRFKWNLACEHKPLVYCLLSNLAWISKGEWAHKSL